MKHLRIALYIAAAAVLLWLIFRGRAQASARVLRVQVAETPVVAVDPLGDGAGSGYGPEAFQAPGFE